jgi:hypothetical protein
VAQWFLATPLYHPRVSQAAFYFKSCGTAVGLSRISRCWRSAPRTATVGTMRLGADAIYHLMR